MKILWKSNRILSALNFSILQSKRINLYERLLVRPKPNNKYIFRLIFSYTSKAILFNGPIKKKKSCNKRRKIKDREKHKIDKYFQKVGSLNLKIVQQKSRWAGDEGTLLGLCRKIISM